MTRQSAKEVMTKENVVKAVFFIVTLFSVVAVFAIIFYVLYGSIPAFSEIGFFKFLFGTEWLASADSYGVGILIVGTLALTGCSLALGGTFGVIVAVWLVFYCPGKVNFAERYRGDSKFVKKCLAIASKINCKRIFGFMINIMAGIPSIVFGLFAYKVVMPGLLMVFNQGGTGTGLLPSTIILSIMILPTITSLFRNSLESVSKDYYEGAVALGSSKHQAIWGVMLPAARKGLASALILGIGRAIGETMAVQMIVGNGSGYPGWFSSFGTLTSNIVKNWGYGSSVALHRSALIADGFVLLVLVLILNLVLMLSQREKTGDNKTFGGVFTRHRRKAAIETVSGLPESGDSPAAVAESANSVSDAGLVRDGRFVPVTDYMTACSEGYSADYMEGFGATSAVRSGTSASSVLLTGTSSDGAGVVAYMPTYVAPGIAQTGPGSDEKYGDDANAPVEYRRKGLGPRIVTCVSWAFAAIVAAVIVWIVAWVLVKGIPNISWHFLFGEYSYSSPTISAALVSTLMLIVLAIVISVPLGVCAAIFLNEYSKKGSRVVKTIRVFIDTLAGVPSIIFGIFGYIFLVSTCHLGYSLWAGGITLAIMVLPTMIRSTEQALSEVPDSVREASYALGAGKVRTIFRVVLPQAMTGIITAIILSIGRILSESAALIFTAGSSGNVMPTGYGSQCASLSVMIYLFMCEGQYYNEAYATAAVVLILVVVLNIIIEVIQHYTKKRREG